MKAHWEFNQLGAVSAINYGYTESASSEPVGPRFLRITDIQDDGVDWESVPYCKIGSADLPKYRLASGDIVFARTGATTGKSFLVDEPPDAVFASYLIRLRLLDKKLLPEFVSLFFQTAGYWKSIKDGSAGSAQGGFNATKLGALSIPIPPLAEQQRIIGILDEAFGALATVKANAEKNLQNARALFESHLQSVFTQRGEGWVVNKLGDVAESISTGPFGTMLHKSDYVPDGIPLVNPMNIVRSRIVPSSKMMVNEETKARLSIYILKAGDIVIGRRGELGRCALVTEREEGWLCGTGSFFVRLSKVMDGEFFVALFGSEQFKARLEASSVGTTMSSLNHGILNDLVLPVPPLAAQRRIMKKAHELLSETQRLEFIYQRKLTALDALKKSLLHQAFTGNL